MKDENTVSIPKSEWDEMSSEICKHLGITDLKYRDDVAKAYAEAILRELSENPEQRSRYPSLFR
ncbi:hypothetical protein [Testudinibacter sp. TR-2022]|uniref:hypothetical protein n=1 Tax=Testudinibacter sp. TR-2022 TaxID=2585029 RepID=UPI00111AABD8|nr:hypothetical protein [Testudinibacter sp. TR-2022]TNH06521.1 hypothetical protein FHQ30_07665 [Pasteurellaceae bacterium Phil11]TNH22547.1 hypothetical protein FHQ29_07335 [Testudinibacter sp. TR-2022]TNH26513.1 hypothetical protein FHQ27_07340 [Testudinibacter sp. TR-2022]